jgi:EpsI family protein
MLSYFWFPVRGRNLINAYELKLATFWGALTRNRTDGALVRVMTTLEEGESMYKAESRIKDFLSRSLPVLDNYLPE